MMATIHTRAKVGRMGIYLFYLKEQRFQPEVKWVGFPGVTGNKSLQEVKIRKATGIGRWARMELEVKYRE